MTWGQGYGYLNQEEKYMEEVPKKVPLPFVYKAGERRGIRSLVQLIFEGRICDFPTDKRSLDRIKSDIMDFIDYSYPRTEEKGYVEEAMIEEFHNIAIVLRAYCEVKYGDLWESVFSDFHKELFRYALEQGVKYNKGLIIKLLTQSEFILALSIYIFQYQAYEYDSNLILDYSDIPTTDMSMLCFMTHQVCPNIKEKIRIDIKKLSVEELVKGIETNYFTDRKEEVTDRIRLLLGRLYHDNNRERYDSIVRDIMMLHIDDYIDLRPMEDMVRDHIVYKLLYHPETVDYEAMDLNTFINIRSRKIVENAITHGGYPLYKRIRREYERNRNVKNIDAFRCILEREDLRRRYYEEREEHRDKNDN